MESFPRGGRGLVAVAALVVALAARSADVEIAWDTDLARPGDQEAYERQLREIVRDARARAMAELGLELRNPPMVKVLSRASFERKFGTDAVYLDTARFIGDVIHVNGGSRLDDRFAGVVVHEMVHAVLDARGTESSLPRWLDEGLAERLAWRRRGLEEPAPNQVAELRQARERRALTPLPLAGELSRFGYLQSWAAVVFLDKRFGREKLMAIVRATLDGEPFEHALRRETGWSGGDMERAFDDWVARI
jgi:hypothetical protein